MFSCWPRAASHGGVSVKRAQPQPVIGPKAIAVLGVSDRGHRRHEGRAARNVRGRAAVPVDPAAPVPAAPVVPAAPLVPAPLVSRPAAPLLHNPPPPSPSPASDSPMLTARTIEASVVLGPVKISARPNLVLSASLRDLDPGAFVNFVESNQMPNIPSLEFCMSKSMNFITFSYCWSALVPFGRGTASCGSRRAPQSGTAGSGGGAAPTGSTPPAARLAVRGAGAAAGWRATRAWTPRRPGRRRRSRTSSGRSSSSASACSARSTYTGSWAASNLDITKFNPTKLDRSWADAAVSAGMAFTRAHDAARRLRARAR